MMIVEILILVILLICFLLSSVSSSSSSSSIPSSSTKPKSNNQKTIILVDVDNTLYKEIDNHIEKQIIHNIQQFVNNIINNDDSFNNNEVNDDNSDEEQRNYTIQHYADILHNKYGSTIDGLCQTIWKDCSKKQLLQNQQQFYNTVYSNISVRNLLRTSQLRMAGESNTGYTHNNNNNNNNQQRQHDDKETHTQEEYEYDTIRTLLKSIVSPERRTVSRTQYNHISNNKYNKGDTELHLVSNSPKQHIEKVVHALGLTRIPWTGIWTPDYYNNYNNDNNDNHSSNNNENSTGTGRQQMNDQNLLVLPTKLYPYQFFTNNFLQSSIIVQEQPEPVPLLSSSSLLDSITSTTTSRTIIIDDSNHIVDTFIQLSSHISGILVNSISSTSTNINVQQAIGIAMNWWTNNNSFISQNSNTKTTKDCTTDNDDQYTFNEIQYLQSKNIVDRESYNCNTYQQLINEIQSSLQLTQQQHNDTTTISNYTIVDIGAGILSMLRLFIEGYDNSYNSNNISGRKVMLPSLINNCFINNNNNSTNTNSTERRIDTIHYYAYEPNVVLLPACFDELQRLGFIQQQQVEIEQQNDEYIFVRNDNKHNDNFENNHLKIIIHLRLWDYRSSSTRAKTNPMKPNLIVGCCFADLIQPYDLVRSIFYNFLSSSDNDNDSTSTCTQNTNSTLLYFPITFCGITQFVPSQSFDTDNNIPSDTIAFNIYSKILREKHKHNLDPYQLEYAIQDYGGTCLHRGKSNWIIPYPTTGTTTNIEELHNDNVNKNIHSNVDSYLWDTMMYFFGTVAASEIQQSGWNAQGWINRARINKPTIHVSNVDLLFRLPHLGMWKIEDSLAPPIVDNDDVDENMTYDEIQFIAPKKVTSIRKQRQKLRRNQIRIKSICSLISSGTELKIFNGMFDDESILDVNIQGMDDQQMKYPLAYGYSLVGQVIECYNDDDCQDLVGKIVFTFSPHASEVVVDDRSSIFIVPNGIEPLDAIFMPSVETAVSIIQDASPILGEKIAVFGQGLIGLLITSILSKFYSFGYAESTLISKFCSITTIDTILDRLAASAAMGSSQALFPSEAKNSGPFDVVIEVSGNSRALQSAIDTTRNGGRIIIASWYGSNDIQLKLDIDFHRSHKVIRSSQVSIIPASLSHLWTKARRFDLTWEILRTIQPSRLLSLRTSLSNAQNAYDSIQSGQEIAIAFEY